MTDREREYANIGLEYAEGIELANVIYLPTGREIRRTSDGWEAQPWNDNYWATFDDLLDAAKFALDRKGVPSPSAWAQERAIPRC